MIAGCHREMEDTILGNAEKHIRRPLLVTILGVLALTSAAAAQQAGSGPGSSSAQPGNSYSETTRDYNQRIAELAHEKKSSAANSVLGDYQIGPEDLLDISVLEAPDLNRTVRVSDDGTISLALLGSIPAAGLTTHELQADLEERLRTTYMTDPQVSVFVQEMKSHPVAVFGAVQKPGVYQLRSAKTLLEVLSMAQGLADDAGDTVIIMRHPDEARNSAVTSLLNSSSQSGAESNAQLQLSAQGHSNSGTGQAAQTESVAISLKDLIDDADSRSNVIVYPGDVVKVNRAGIVYVVGQVNKPGGFVLKTNENISVLQAIALAEGMAPDSKGKAAQIFVAGGSGDSRKEIAINLDKVMQGKEAAPFLKPNDVLFVPSSTGKHALRSLQQTTFGIAGALGSAAIYRW